MEGKILPGIVGNSAEKRRNLVLIAHGEHYSNLIKYTQGYIRIYASNNIMCAVRLLQKMNLLQGSSGRCSSQMGG